MASSVKVTLKKYPPIMALALTLGFLIGYPLIKAEKSLGNLFSVYKVPRSVWRLSVIGAAAYLGATVLAPLAIPLLGLGSLGAVGGVMAVSYASAYVGAFVAKHIARGLSYLTYGVFKFSYGDGIGGPQYPILCPTNPEKYRPTLPPHALKSDLSASCGKFNADYSSMRNHYNHHIKTGKSVTSDVKVIRDLGRLAL